MKALVLYYSRTGNTKFVAEEIAKATKADIEEIIDKKKRTGIVGWVIAGYDANRMKQANIKKLKSNIKKYDTIFIGQPVWAWTINPAIRALFDKNDLSGKKIVLFCTMDGQNDGHCLEHTEAILGDDKVIGKRAFRKPIKSKELTIENVKVFVENLGKTS